MPKREKHRKKTRYSSDSSDSYRERSSRSSRRKVSSRRKSSSSRSRHDSSSSSSRSSSSSSSSHDSRRHSSRSSSIQNKKSASGYKEIEQIQKFDLDGLYKEDKTKILEDIESNTFKQATFKQSSSKIIVDLEKDKILLPASSIQQEDEAKIHPNYLGDNEKRVDKWIKKLYIYRNQ